MGIACVWLLQKYKGNHELFRSGEKFLEQIKTKGKRYMNFVSLSFLKAC